jgi:hypothetical protein
VLLDVVLGDKANATLPVRGRVLEDVVDGELVGVLGRDAVELVLHEDVLDADVGVDERDLRRVERVLHGCLDDLEHGRDTGAASDHADISREVGAVEEQTLGALDADLLADFELVDVLGDVALRVSLMWGNFGQGRCMINRKLH